MTESIDLAFVDRADIKQYLDMPSVQAIYKVYHSCINELIKVQSKLKNWIWSTNYVDFLGQNYTRPYLRAHRAPYE